MEDDANIRIIVELISSRNATEGKEVIARNPSIPSYLLTDDFRKRMQDIVRFKTMITLHRWKSFFDTCYKKMLSSHEMYLTFIMFACINEQTYHRNVFDSLVSACILVNLVTDETLSKTGTNFRHLSSDIVMVFYKKELKVFGKRAGFLRFLEFVRGHRYVVGNGYKKYLPSKGSIDANTLQRDINEKLRKELCGVNRTIINPDEIASDQKSIYLANLVLLLPSINLPTLPSYPDLIKALVAYRKNGLPKTEEKGKNEMAMKFEALDAALQECSNPITDSKAKYEAKHQEDVKRSENIIQAVIRRNHSKGSGNENANNRIQQEANEILEHLKGTINSLLEVLDEYETK